MSITDLFDAHEVLDIKETVEEKEQQRGEASNGGR
jgi:hypothetical protein